jgi:hypothetical protein
MAIRSALVGLQPVSVRFDIDSEIVKGVIYTSCALINGEAPINLESIKIKPQKVSYNA